ncbi:MAG: enoyl-CoA hydratase/isomerase family protein [Caulobacteraceae bacterium]|nr:enoyl-CoA hydratase/isomerase family protein [Caulobacteraceae bacterium]
MRETTQVKFERQGAIAKLTLDRASQLNALSPTLIDEALHVTQEVAAPDARVLIITGAGRSFSAGVDLKAATSPEYTKEVAKTFSQQARELIVLFESMPQATIAQVRGHCYTGGLELALGCDFIISSDEAKFCDTHAKIGMRGSGWGLSQRLPLRVGLQRAKEMSLTARVVGPEEALRLGLILEYTPLDALEARVIELAEQIATIDPESVAAYKTLYRYSLNMGLDDGVAAESALKRTPNRTKPLTEYLTKPA